MRLNFAALKKAFTFQQVLSLSAFLSLLKRLILERATTHSDTLAFALVEAFVDVLVALELLLEALGAHTDAAEEQEDEEDEEDATDDTRDNAIRVLLIFGIPQGLFLSRKDTVKLIVQLVEV